MSGVDYGAEADAYIKSRVDQYTQWYDSKAVHCKRNYLRNRSAVVVCGVIVPVLINSNFKIVFACGYSVSGASVAAIVSLFVAVLVALEGVFRYKEQWKNYRSTEQLIGHEKYMYITRVGEYASLTDEKAFKLFVERVENAIYSENLSTLNVLTTSSETKVVQQRTKTEDS